MPYRRDPKNWILVTKENRDAIVAFLVAHKLKHFKPALAPKGRKREWEETSDAVRNGWALKVTLIPTTPDERSTRIGNTGGNFNVSLR